MASSTVASLDLAVDNHRLQLRGQDPEFALIAQRRAYMKSIQDFDAHNEMQSSPGTYQRHFVQTRTGESSHLRWFERETPLRDDPGEALHSSNHPGAAHKRSSGETVHHVDAKHVQSLAGLAQGSSHRAPNNLHDDVTETGCAPAEDTCQSPQHSRIQADLWASQSSGANSMPGSSNDSRIGSTHRPAGDTSISTSFSPDQPEIRDPVVSGPDSPYVESATDILSRFIPKDCVLRSSIQKRHSSLWLVNDCKETYENSFGPGNSVPLRTTFQDLKPLIETGSVLIIEDLSIDTCEALVAEYPCLDQAFLIQHMLRLDEAITGNSLEELEMEIRRYHPSSDGLSIGFSQDRTGISISLDLQISVQDQHCFHLDLDHGQWTEGRDRLNMVEAMVHTSPESRWSKCRKNTFSKTRDGTWTRTSTRISCCRLLEMSCKCASRIVAVNCG